MLYREAHSDDIAQIQIVRNAVKENRLSNPDIVPDKDVLFYITEKGKGWVCIAGEKIVGFSIVDLQENNIWALFVHPDYAEKGIGKELHWLMLAWYFEQTRKTVCLGTAPNTRAEVFYTKQGWNAVGTYTNGEVKFEMTFENYQSKQES